MDMKVYVSCYIPSIKQTVMRIIYIGSECTILEARDQILQALGLGEKKVLQSLGLEREEYLFSGTQVSLLRIAVVGVNFLCSHNYLLLLFLSLFSSQSFKTCSISSPTFFLHLLSCIIFILFRSVVLPTSSSYTSYFHRHRCSGFPTSVSLDVF